MTMDCTQSSAHGLNQCEMLVPNKQKNWGKKGGFGAHRGCNIAEKHKKRRKKPF